VAFVYQLSVFVDVQPFTDEPHPCSSSACQSQATLAALLSHTYSPFIRYSVSMFDPNAHMPRINRGMVYLGACLIAGIWLAREAHVNHRMREIYIWVFHKVPEMMMEK
jgi:hypothetical protein